MIALFSSMNIVNGTHNLMKHLFGRQRTNRRHKNGQALVEYALILALVAIVAIVGISVLGRATQRSIGTVAGELGAEGAGDLNGEQISIDQADCWVVTSSNQTGIFVTFTTNAPLTGIKGSTTADRSASGPVSSYGALPGGGVYQPVLSSTVASADLCPQSVVLQSEKGALAIAQLVVKYAP
jgi:Flp pilus assembly pilin Flp